MSMSLQFTFKALPGSDLATITEKCKEAAKLWKKHGATHATLGFMTVGEMGHMSFIVDYENFAKYGAGYDTLSADPEFRKWQVDVMKLGMTEWVRGNIVRKVSLE